MTRNLKALGLGLLAAVALGALASFGAADAVETHTFKFSNKKTVLTGTSEEKSIFKGGKTEVVCDAAHHAGTVSAETFTADHLTLFTVYTECKHPTEGVSVSMTGCTYTFDSDTEEFQTPGQEVETHATTSIVCSGANTIQIAFANCTVRFGSQTPEQEGATYANILEQAKDPNQKETTVQALTIKETVGEILVAEKVGPLCAQFPDEWTYTGTFKLTGYEDLGGNPEKHEYKDGNLVDISITTP